MDPLLLRGTAKRYVLFNVHRGLFYYDKDNKISNHGAKTCAWSSDKNFDCHLADKKWSDGSPIKAEHYVYSYQQIKTLNDESLTAVQGIEEVLAVSEKTLRFVFQQKEESVRHRLTSLSLSPRNKNMVFKNLKEQLFSGPYKVQSLDQKNIHLKSNNHYDSNNRPKVTGVFVDDPSAALNMYESGKLDFLRYLESSNIGVYPNVLFAPFAKLDGLFLNQEKLPLNLRKALIYALDFKALQKLYKSPSVPGCLAVPKFFFKEEIECFKFDLKKSKDSFEKFKTNDLSQVNEIKNLKIHIPSVDADEHKKLALWAREQWLNHLGISVQIELVETKMFYEKVQKSEYSIYRKAHPLENLSCTEAMASLKRESEFSKIKFTSKNCRDFFKEALGSYSWIPLGLPYYAHLPSKNFSGYYINLLGQFGLEDLRKIE